MTNCHCSNPEDVNIRCPAKQEILIATGFTLMASMGLALPYIKNIGNLAMFYSGTLYNNLKEATGYNIYDDMYHNNKKNIFIASGVLLIGFIAALYRVNHMLNIDAIDYKPFATDIEQVIDDKNIVAIKTSPVMIGNENNNLLIADEKGSKIWAKQGSNYMVAHDGNDVFYFSLCSTKIINNTVSVIQKFESGFDKLKFFCTKHQIKPEDIVIKANDGHSCIEVKGAVEKTAICLLGNSDITLNDIMITNLGEVQQELEIL